MDVETVEVRPAHRAPLRWGVIAMAAAAALIVGAVLLAPRASVCDVRAFAPGSGDGRTPQTPLLVHDATALDAVRDCLDRHHLQVDDILPNAPFVPLGLTSDATVGLSGSYEGGGHSIVDLRIFLPGVDGVGLFVSLDGGRVADLTLLRPRVEGGSSVAALAGSMTGGSTVEGIRVLDAVIRAEDVAGLVAGTSSDAVTLEAERLDGSVQVDGLIMGTHIGRIRTGADPARAASAPAPSPEGFTSDLHDASGVTLTGAGGPATRRAVGEVLGAG